MPIARAAGVSTRVGEFFEEAAAVLFNARRYRVRAHCLCPDLVGESVFIECKAMIHSAYVYLHPEYVTLVDETQRPLVYVVWSYKLRPSDYPFREALRAALAQSVEAVHLVDGRFLREWLPKHCISAGWILFPVLYMVSHNFSLRSFSPTLHF